MTLNRNENARRVLKDFTDLIDWFRDAERRCGLCGGSDSHDDDCLYWAVRDRDPVGVAQELATLDPLRTICVDGWGDQLYLVCMFCQGAFAGAQHHWSCVWLRANALEGRPDPQRARLILSCPLDLADCDFVRVESEVNRLSLHLFVLGNEGLPPYIACLHPRELSLTFSGHLLVHGTIPLSGPAHEERMRDEGITVVAVRHPLDCDTGLVFSTTAGELSVCADELRFGWSYSK